MSQMIEIECEPDESMDAIGQGQAERPKSQEWSWQLTGRWIEKLQESNDNELIGLAINNCVN